MLGNHYRDILRKNVQFIVRLVYCLFSIAMILAPDGVVASVYYVDNLKGDDENNGQYEKPFRAVLNALRRVKGGDELVLVAHGPSHPYRGGMVFKHVKNDGGRISIGGVGGAEPYLVGSVDWSDVRAGGSTKWVRLNDGSVQLKGVPAPAALWFTSVSAWRESGVDALQERIKKDESAIDLLPGEWHYSKEKKIITYRLLPDEEIASMHIEAVTMPTIIITYNRHNLTFHDMRLAFSSNTAMTITGGSENIEMRNISIRNAMNNGISVSGGGDNILIEKCQIQNAANNGIVLLGSPAHKLKNTVIRECRVMQTRTNDCITLHGNEYGDSIGGGHLIENNVLSECAEQGIDVTSGRDISLVGNTTHHNGDSGIVIGHGAERVLVDRHISNHDGRYAGIIINRSKSVRVINSCFYDSDNHQVVISDANGVTFENNTLLGGVASKDAVLDIAIGTKGVVFRRNIISSLIAYRGAVLLRYLRGTNPQEAEAYFDENVWWSSVDDGRQFYTQAAGWHGFAWHQKRYRQELNGKYADPGIARDGHNLVIDDNKGYSDYGCDRNMMLKRIKIMN